MSNEKNPEQLKPNYWYTDKDCNDYFRAAIATGALLDGLKKDKNYLLEGQTPAKNGKNWHVLVTSPVNGQSNIPAHTLGIDYFLDKDKQANTMIAIFKEIAESQVKDDGSIDLDDEALMVIITKHGGDKSTFDTVKVALEDLKYDKDRIDGEVKVREKYEKSDVFDEINEVLVPGQEQYFKILFDCNVGNYPAEVGQPSGGTHWTTGEIQIVKQEDGNCVIKVFQHDPCGGGIMSDENYQKIQTAVSKRLKDIGLIKSKLYENSLSPYGKRQSDNASCGVIASEDLVLLANGKNLPKEPYPAGAVKLREKQFNAIKDLRGEAPVESREKSEVELPSPKAASPKEIQAIRDTRRTLESVGYSSDKIKEKNGNLTVKHNKDEINITRTPLAHKITTESTDAGTLTEMVRMAAAMIDEFNKNKNPDQKIEKSINIKPADEAARGILMKACQDYGLKFNVESEPAPPVEAEEEEVRHNLNGPAIRNM